MREDRSRAVWETELDRLELDVIRVERLVKGPGSVPVEPWNPPSVAGQMPADLALRAQDLLDRQEQAVSDLRAALTEAHRQLAYADRVTDIVRPSGPRPVYVDVDA